MNDDEKRIVIARLREQGFHDKADRIEATLPPKEEPPVEPNQG